MNLYGPTLRIRKKIRFSPLKQLNNGFFSSPPRAKTQLKFVNTEYDAGMELEEMVDDKSVGVGGQPCQQLWKSLAGMFEI